ncbi:MAG: FAD-dependent oxidoreductase [Clostridiales bacterium]|nr:FAD-dependent oxidoreductase [Clostridiales bacterium]
MYDVIIIGGGPSGITAGIYAIRSGLKTLVLEKTNLGGQVINTYEIKNFPTYTNISGTDFCSLLYSQAEYNNLEIKYEEVVEANLSENIKKIKTNTNAYESKTVIICSGAKPKNLNLENEQELVGKGISYCALCDGNFFKNKTVAVIGGGDTALEDSIYLSGLCKKVYIINRSNKLRGQQILQDSLKVHIQENKNIELMYNAEVNKIYGDNFLTSIDVLDKTTNTIKNLEVDGMFLAIGRTPDTDKFNKQIKLNDYGYIVVNNKMQTSLKGVFAGGDCIEKEIRQILTACSDGALCATFANHYIKGE